MCTHAGVGPALMGSWSLPPPLGWWLERMRASPKETQGSRLKQPKKRQSSQSRGVQSPGVPLVPGVRGLCRLQLGSSREETSPCSAAKMRGPGEQRDLVRCTQCSSAKIQCLLSYLSVFPKELLLIPKQIPQCFFQKLILGAFERQGPPSSSD